MYLPDVLAPPPEVVLSVRASRSMLWTCLRKRDFIEYIECDDKRICMSAGGDHQTEHKTDSLFV